MHTCNKIKSCELITFSYKTQHILQKAREKSEYDKDKLESEKSFTPERIQTLFCNIEDILAFHKELLTHLESCIGSKGPAYDTEIASCFVRQVSQEWK